MVLKRKILLFFAICFLFFSIILCSAKEISISPTKFNFNISVGAGKCFSINIFSEDYSGDILIQDRWNKENTQILNDYTSKADSFGLLINYNNKIFLENKTDMRFCISGSTPGEYAGALLFNPANSSVGIGAWVSLRVFEENANNDNSQGQTYFNKITGSVVGGINKANIFFFILVFSNIFLCCVLLLLLLYLNKKKQEK